MPCFDLLQNIEQGAILHNWFTNGCLLFVFTSIALPVATAIEVDRTLACGILLSVDNSTESFLRLAFPAVYGTLTPRIREQSRKVIETHQRHFESPASPRVVAQRAEVLASAPIVLNRNFQTQQDLLRDRVFDRVVVVTHPSNTFFEEKVAEGLDNDPRFESVPRIILASEDFPLATVDLLSRATLLQYSAAGDMTPAPVVKSAYLMGGYAFYCLAHTARELIREALLSNRDGVELIFVSKFIYHNDYENELYGEVNRAFIRPSALKPDRVAELLLQYLLADHEHDEIPLPAMQPTPHGSFMTSARVWEGRFYFTANPRFTIRIVIDGDL